jgi:hypothetical protein
VEIPTSHVDLIPTLLGLIGADAEQIRASLSATHTEARALVGRDLSGIIVGSTDPSTLLQPIYFMTDDDPARGDQESNPIGLQAGTVVQPNKLDTVITIVNGQVWKYTEYRDDPAYWTTPPTQDFRDRPLQQAPTSPGTYTQPYEVTVKTQPVQPQPRDFEMYNLATDPLELNNLALDPAFAAMKAQLAQALAQQRALKRLTPGGGSSGTGARPGAGPSQSIPRSADSTGENDPRRLTETERRQRERTNQLGLDDAHTEGNVVEVNLDANPPSVVIGTRDGRQVVRLDCSGGCPEVQVGDYLEAEGSKEHEQLFLAEGVVVTRGGQRVR